MNCKNHILILSFLTLFTIQVSAQDYFDIGIILDQIDIELDSFKTDYNEISSHAMFNHVDGKIVNSKGYYYSSLTIDSNFKAYVIPMVSNRYDEFTYELDNHIFVLDSSKNLIDHLIEKRRWICDAQYVSSVSIDTIYSIENCTSIINLSVVYGASGYGLYGNNKSSLYLFENQRLRKVLNNFDMYLYNGEPISLPDDKEVFRILNRQIEIDTNKTNGYQDIIVKNSVEKTESWKRQDEPKNNSTQILKYNMTNKEYELEK